MASWGFVWYPSDPNVGNPGDVKHLFDASGPIILEQDDPFFIGAERRTNATGEMAAVIEGSCAWHVCDAACRPKHQYTKSMVF